MIVRSFVLTLAVVTGCDGIRSDPGQMVDGAVDSAPADHAADSTAAREVVEVEPNDERAGATQLPAGGGEFVIRGTCGDSADNDYYDANSGTGPYSVRLEWQAGSYQMMFDPEDGFTGGQTESTTPPIIASGQVIVPSELPRPQFNIDCYNAGNPSGLTGLAYTAYLTLPQ